MQEPFYVIKIDDELTNNNIVSDHMQEHFHGIF